MQSELEDSVCKMFFDCTKLSTYVAQYGVQHLELNFFVTGYKGYTGYCIYSYSYTLKAGRATHILWIVAIYTHAVH